VVGELLLRSSGEGGRSPQIRRQESVGLGQGVVNSHGKISTSTGVSRRGGVHVVNASHGEKLLWDHRSDDTRSSRSRDEADTARTALARNLGRDSVWEARVDAPVTTTHWNNVHLRADDGTSDGSSDFLSGLAANADMAVSITNRNVALEAGALTSSGLLLHWADLHDFVLQGRA